MTRLGIGLLAVAVAGGCTKTPPPIQVARPIETDPTPAAVKLEKTPAPAKSDPASVAVVEAALKAHTGGKPELLAGWKSTSYKLDGVVTPRTPTAATLEVKMEWPGKFRANWQLGPQVAYSQVRSGDAVWFETKGGEKNLAEPEKARDLITDTPGEWLGFLGCLTDPSVVVGPYPPADALDRPTVGVRVWSPLLPPAALHFEADTKRLAQVTVLGRENGKDVTKEFVYKKGAVFTLPNGVLLPDERVVKIDGSPIAEWKLLSAEFGAPVDAKGFEPPK